MKNHTPIAKAATIGRCETSAHPAAPPPMTTVTAIEP